MEPKAGGTADLTACLRSRGTGCTGTDTANQQQTGRMELCTQCITVYDPERSTGTVAVLAAKNRTSTVAAETSTDTVAGTGKADCRLSNGYYASANGDCWKAAV